MIYAVTDARVVSARIDRKVERALGRMGLCEAIQTVAVLRHGGIMVVGDRAWMNRLPGTKYPYPSYQVEMGECKWVAPFTVPSSQEYVN